MMAVRKDEALFAECKWQNAEANVDVYYELKRKSEMFGFAKNHLYIFTKRAAAAKLLQLQYEHQLVTLFALPEMIEEFKKQESEQPGVYEV
ncbi:MAG: hypothetical protein FWF69_08680 [Firmicutes bacterium]|nr:hypothetical protein [Bacillota bacterium]